MLFGERRGSNSRELEEERLVPKLCKYKHYIITQSQRLNMKYQAILSEGKKDLPKCPPTTTSPF